MPRLTEAEKLRIVHLAAEGFTVRAISLIVGCCKKTVRFWIHRRQHQGSARSIPGSGRPLLLDPRARRRAVELLAEGVDGVARASI